MKGRFAVVVVVMMATATSCDRLGCGRASRPDAGSASVTDSSQEPRLGNQALDQSWEEVDPYCGMHLRRSEAAATMEYHGHTYYFCLRDHRDAFARDPERYLSLRRGGDGGPVGEEADGGTAPDAS